MLVFPVGLPSTLVKRAINVDHFSDALLNEELVLAEVDIAVWVEKLSDGSAVALIELTLEDDSCIKEQVG